MLRIINQLLEIVFPERPSHALIAKLTTDDFKRHYNPQTGSDFTALLPFNEPVVRAAIHEAKFHRSEHAYQLPAAILSTYLGTYQGTYLVLPIPLSGKRQKKRKYNQVTEVLKLALKDYPDLTLRTDILYRKWDTVPQTSLPKKDRLKNVADAFGGRHFQGNLIKDSNILLIDDVATTGATLKAARRALAPHSPATIKCLALAH